VLIILTSVMLCPSTGPILPQELLDKIVGSVCDTEDLRSCAISASSLLPTAQMLLFSDISVDHPRKYTGNPPTEDEDRTFTAAAFRRLASLLIDSPHLVRYIESVSTTAYLDVVTVLADMNLSHLCDLTLCGDVSNSIDGTLIEPVRRLIALESMRRVKIRADFSAEILSAPPPHLTELVFDDAEENGGSCIVSLAAGAPCTEVKYLTLYNSPGIADWLVDVDCPFDFTHLLEVVVLASMSDGTRKLLDSAKHRIRTLVLTTCASLVL
jgi:hypothetical protein